MQHNTPVPTLADSLSPSAPSPLPVPIDDDTTSSFTASSFLSDSTSSAPSSFLNNPSSSSSVTLNLNAATFGCLLAIAFAACMISGLTFQWLIEKGLFRKKKFLEKANQYNVIVAVTSLAAFLQTITCFLQALLDEPNVVLSAFMLLQWIFMTHGSVMIVARKVSLTYNNAEQAWKRLLYINAAMMVVSVAVVVVWMMGSHLYSDGDDAEEVLEDIQRILEPTQMALWGLLEFALSGMFIVQMRKYYWQSVERKGIFALLVVGLCDIGLVSLNVGLGDYLLSACARAFVYALRIRLELEVLSAMVTYIQNKRKQVVYMAQQQRKKQRRSRRRKNKGGSSGGLDDDDDSDASQRSAGSVFSSFSKKLRRRKSKCRKNEPELDFGDENGSVGSYQSVFSVFKRKSRRGGSSGGLGTGSSNGGLGQDIDDDDDSRSVASHMSVFRRLPHATDYSNIFQHSFMHDFAVATTHSKTFLQSIGKKCRSLAVVVNDACSVRSLGSKKSMKSKSRRRLGGFTERTHPTVRNSTSSCEIPMLQGMEIKLAPTSELMGELGEESDTLMDSEVDMEEGAYHCRRRPRFDMSSSLHISSSLHVDSTVYDSDREGGDEPEIVPFPPLVSGPSSVSDCSSSGDSSDEEEGESKDALQPLQASYHTHTSITKPPVRLQSIVQSSDDDDETSDDEEEEKDDNPREQEEDDDDDEPMMFGIPRKSFKLKANVADLTNEEEEQDAPFGIPREPFKIKPATPRTPAAGGNGGPALRRTISLNKQALPALRRTSSARRLRESRLLNRIARRDRRRRTDEGESEEFQKALDKLESMDCL